MNTLLYSEVRKLCSFAVRIILILHLDRRFDNPTLYVSAFPYKLRKFAFPRPRLGVQ